ncbi:MAG TPA: ATP-binding protein [Hydrogenophaga sp.]|uniref:ATP-binding protein n=1 Tax=Hydrogenophaga sp. TaxID=1904254 RepID=UPI002C12BFC6|nr:ATP-binding protein [Hydrogenophaga sp.]HSX94065.1 ATP-binding protein [Hydrogenophaga sp.]
MFSATAYPSHELLLPYNAWWAQGRDAFADLPALRRDVFDDLYADVKGLPQVVSVTGPRRVGKSTLLQQCIQQLLTDADDPGALAQRIVYFSMQDPGLELPGFDLDHFFNELVKAAATAAKEGVAYLFLDEIQRFPRWELYLKKFYDLKTPVRFVVSGSASTPIFRKSRESLLGRIKDYHVLPFSFREWLYMRMQETAPEEQLFALRKLGDMGRGVQAHFSAEAVATVLQVAAQHAAMADSHVSVENFLFEGGFPEVWNLPTLLAKQDYLYQNQVERVIFEDLLLAAEFRKPEMLRRFYLGLLKDPGRETNLSQVSKELGMVRSTIESYFPLLEATDLVWRLHKHTSTKATPKAGNFKTYLVDLAVRNAVMKLNQAHLVADATLMGAYAENVVANHLRRWPGLVELGYWRRNNDEIDFIVDLGHSRIAVEVKYRNEVQDKDILKAAELANQLGCEACVVVCKGPLETAAIDRLKKAAAVPLAVVPLAAFLMLF